MNSNNFNEDDKKKVVEFLNFVSSKAEFKVNTQEVIGYFKLLSYMQQELLPKIDSNILELKEVIEPKDEE